MTEPYIRDDEDDQSLWLEPCDGDVCLGLCLGTGVTQADRIAEARLALAEAARQLDALVTR